MRHIGFTGTQQGLTELQYSTLRSVFVRLYIPSVILHFGDCIGADQEAAVLAQSLGYLLHSHPPDIDRKRAFVAADLTEQPLPYLVRNRKIVEASSVLLACPAEKSEQQRSGTWSTVRYARKLESWIVFVYPDGSVWLEHRGIAQEVGDLHTTHCV